MRFNKKLIIFLKTPFKRLTTGFVFAIMKAQSEVDMRFYTLAERKPIGEQEILIKCHYGLKKHSYYFGIWGCDEYSNYKRAVFIPALSDDTGAEYIYEEDIIGWMPIEDLDEIKVGE